MPLWRGLPLPCAPQSGRAARALSEEEERLRPRRVRCSSRSSAAGSRWFKGSRGSAHPAHEDVDAYRGVALVDDLDRYVSLIDAGVVVFVARMRDFADAHRTRPT